MVVYGVEPSVQKTQTPPCQRQAKVPPVNEIKYFRVFVIFIYSVLLFQYLYFSTTIWLYDILARTSYATLEVMRQ